MLATRLVVGSVLLDVFLATLLKITYLSSVMLLYTTPYIMDNFAGNDDFVFCLLNCLSLLTKYFCADPANAAIVTNFGGIPLIIQCLSSPVRNTVNYAPGALYYICNESNKGEILKPEVIDVIERYAAAEEVSVSFSNLAKAFLDKHLSKN
ncbi:hypothetical protein Fmac_005925 [Flemingia macrophylla]|uniref:Uncharacterized protein n=1 Tax=Flemingia macrophylla TaxID=520843 RepID=A0ABD1N972_9FABA